MYEKKILAKTSFFLIMGGAALFACQAEEATPEADVALQPSVTMVETETQVQVPTSTPAPTATPEPSPSPVPLEGLAAALSGAGLEVNPDPRRGSLFNLNTLAFELPGMDDVEVVNVTYAFHGDEPLTLDVYYPPGTSEDARLPTVIFGLGFPMSKYALRNYHQYTSWGKLVAAAGMIGINYDTEQPEADLETLIAFIREHAEALRIDPNQMGFWTCSDNVPTVITYLMQEGREEFQFGIYYYGRAPNLDKKYAEQTGQSCPEEGCQVDELAQVAYVDPDLPLFVVKPEHDVVLNKGMDRFLGYVQAAGAPVTVIDYEDGRHGFDTEQKTEESAEIIAQTIEFMKENFGMD